MSPDDLLAPDDAAAYLAVSAKTLERWRGLDFGPPFAKLGQGIRYKRADLNSFFLANRVEPATHGRIDRETR